MPQKRSRGHARVLEEDVDETEVNLVDIDFDFFDPQPQDYHALVSLLRQLLSYDAVEFDIGRIAELILDQKTIGSTVKCDGKESDPYAFCTVLNLNARKEDAVIAALSSYLVAKAGSSVLHNRLEQILSTSGTTGHLGLVLSERLINMPPQIAPPMYRMLEEELQWARDEHELFDFSHLLFISRTFVPDIDDGEGSQVLQSKKGAATSHPSTKQTGLFAYHAEDDVIASFSEMIADFTYTYAPERDSIDPFGVDIRGRLMLVPADALQLLSQEMDRWLTG